jgi:hypothetical protein
MFQHFFNGNSSVGEKFDSTKSFGYPKLICICHKKIIMTCVPFAKKKYNHPIKKRLFPETLYLAVGFDY